MDKTRVESEDESARITNEIDDEEIRLLLMALAQQGVRAARDAWPKTVRVSDHITPCR